MSRLKRLKWYIHNYMIRTIKIYLCKLLIKKVESTRILSPLPPESLTEKKKKKESRWMGDGNTFWKRGNEEELLRRKSRDCSVMPAEGTPHINQCALSPRKGSRLGGTETNHKGWGRGDVGQKTGESVNASIWNTWIPRSAPHPSPRTETFSQSKRQLAQGASRCLSATYTYI